jgi:hypothetical protein
LWAPRKTTGNCLEEKDRKCNKMPYIKGTIRIPCSADYLVNSDGKPVRSLGAQAARLPQAGVWHRQTPTLSPKTLLYHQSLIKRRGAEAQRGRDAKRKTGQSVCICVHLW